MARTRTSPIRFSGPPDRLTADVKLPGEMSTQARIIVGSEEFPLRVISDGKTISSLAFSLPADSPPGKLKCQVLVGDASFDGVANVQVLSSISVEPVNIALLARAGETVTATLKVKNRGNGTLEFHADKAVTLRPVGTLARSVKSVFKNSDRGFSDHIIALGQEMAAAPSHQLKVTANMAAALLKKGGHSTVTLKLGIPKDMAPDTTWTGSLGLLGKRVRIDIDTRHVG